MREHELLHPLRIDDAIGNEMRRDNQSLSRNENFGVMFDTFHDRRNSFMFHVNLLGGLTDALAVDERNVNKDWNTVWNARTARFEHGWTVEMAIPFKSLRFRSGEAQVWGVNFRRIVQWKNEWPDGLYVASTSAIAPSQRSRKAVRPKGLRAARLAESVMVLSLAVRSCPSGTARPNTRRPRGP